MRASAARWLAAAALLVAACSSSATPPAATQAVTQTRAVATTAPPTPVPTVAPTPTPVPKFPSGIYVMRPRAEGPGGQLELIGGTLTQSMLPAPQFTNNLNFSPLWPQWR